MCVCTVCVYCVCVHVLCVCVHVLCVCVHVLCVCVLCVCTVCVYMYCVCVYMYCVLSVSVSTHILPCMCPYKFPFAAPYVLSIHSILADVWE